MKTKYLLGTIELSTEVYVSDPCYSIDTWCQAVVSGLKPGKYYGFMNKQDIKGVLEGIRVVDLWITHEDNIKAFPRTLIKDALIGVDSGAAGIYDKEYYEKYHQCEYISEDEESAEWYDKQFNLRYFYDMDGNRIDYSYDKFEDTERRDGIALDNKCVISSSGYGDGAYHLYSTKNSKGEIVALRIKFI